METMSQNHPTYHEDIRLKDVTMESDVHPVYHVAQCRSTMDLARDLIVQDRLPFWASVLSDSQTAGRGQLGRNWASPMGNVYGSVHLPIPVHEWRELSSLVIALAVVNVFAGYGLNPVVKWPNDILILGRKAAGILVEGGDGSLIAGIGINLVSCPDEGVLHHPLSAIPCHLEEFGVSVAPMEIWSSLVRQIRLCFEPALSGERPETFIGKLQPRMAFMGERALADAYEGAGQPVIVKRIDIRGGLVVQTAQGEQTLRSGSLYPLI